MSKWFFEPNCVIRCLICCMVTFCSFFKWKFHWLHLFMSPVDVARRMTMFVFEYWSNCCRCVYIHASFPFWFVPINAFSILPQALFASGMSFRCTFLHAKMEWINLQRIDYNYLLLHWHRINVAYDCILKCSTDCHYFW